MPKTSMIMEEASTVEVYKHKDIHTSIHTYTHINTHTYTEVVNGYFCLSNNKILKVFDVKR